jgi:branched-chain amino acid transport system substrate-binding protein
MLKAIRISCSDHEGARDGRVQQWDGKGWKVISDWYTADEALIDPLVNDVSTKYAVDKKIQPRDCAKAS